MSTLKVVETRYQGYRFRSRLEARWAVFFDALGLDWRYEHEGYDLVVPTYMQTDFGRHAWYLPDFVVKPNAFSTFVEIKPFFAPHFDQSEQNFFMTSGMLDMIAWKMPELVRTTGRDGLILSGDPWPGSYHALFYPMEDPDGYYGSGYFQLADCAICGGFRFVDMYPDEDPRVPHRDVHDLPWMCKCPSEGAFFAGSHLNGERIMAAYKAARSARFEHGETPDK